MASVIITSILWMALYIGSCSTKNSDKDSLIFIRNPIEGEVPGHWIPKRVLKNIMSGVKPPIIKPKMKDIVFKSSPAPPPAKSKQTPHEKMEPRDPPELLVTHNPPYTSNKEPELKSEPIEPTSPEAKTTEETTTVKLKAEEPATGEPTSGEPTTEESTTKESTTEEIVTEAPTTEEPTTAETTAADEFEKVTDSPEDPPAETEPTKRNTAHSRKRTKPHKKANTDSRNKKK